VAVRKGLNQQKPDHRYLHTILRTQLEFIELVGGDKIKMPCLIEPDIVATRKPLSLDLFSNLSAADAMNPFRSAFPCYSRSHSLISRFQGRRYPR